ncbi:MAG: hypothetical protein ACUVXI_02625 [bacterium]
MFRRTPLSGRWFHIFLAAFLFVASSSIWIATDVVLRRKVHLGWIVSTDAWAIFWGLVLALGAVGMMVSGLIIVANAIYLCGGRKRPSDFILLLPEFPRVRERKAPLLKPRVLSVGDGEDVVILVERKRGRK